MNTYHISACVSYLQTFVVEAETEEKAILEVEWGNVDPDESERDYIENIRVDDVELGEVFYKVDVEMSISMQGERGDNLDADVRGATLDMLNSFIGTASSCGEKGTIEVNDVRMGKLTKDSE